MIAVAALLAGGCGGGSGTDAEAPLPAPSAPLPQFAADGIWRTPLAPDAPLDPASVSVVADLVGQVERAGAWINGDRFSTPVYVVPADQPTVTVTDTDDGFMNDSTEPSAWGPVPLPADARPAAGTDRHLVVWQPGTDTMWEFWDLRRGPDGRVTSPAGARIPGVSADDGVIPAPYGATASGLPVAAGMITPEDVRAGRIDHLLAIAIPEPRAEWLTAPATRTDGSARRESAPLMGSRFRLPADLDVDALGLHPLVRMLAEAARTHGLVVRDTAGAVVFFAEDPAGRGVDPIAPLIGDADLGELMRTFPWDRLQLLQTDPVCCWRAP